MVHFDKDTSASFLGILFPMAVAVLVTFIFIHMLKINNVIIKAVKDKMTNDKRKKKKRKKEKPSLLVIGSNGQEIIIRFNDGYGTNIFFAWTSSRH